MKTKKIYSVIATFASVGLSISTYSLKKELRETEEVLEQCSDRYHKVISRLKSQLKLGF